MKLTEYRAKRDFKKTPEPSGQEGVAPGEPLRFVVHKHLASRLHWDLRLELELLDCRHFASGVVFVRYRPETAG